MKSRSLMLYVALLLSTWSVAQAVESPIISIEYLADQRIVLYIDDAELDHTPAWDPTMPQLPLSVSDAVLAVVKWAKTNHPNYGDVEVREVVLKNIPTREDHKRWFYLVYLDALQDGRVVPTQHLFAAVLFDGKVIPATVEPKY